MKEFYTGGVKKTPNLSSFKEIHLLLIDPFASISGSRARSSDALPLALPQGSSKSWCSPNQALKNWNLGLSQMIQLLLLGSSFLSAGLVSAPAFNGCSHSLFP